VWSAQAVGRADECGEEFQKQYAHVVVSLAETNQLVEPALRRVHARSPLVPPPSLAQLAARAVQESQRLTITVLGRASTRPRPTET
jgi:hypothetical protein